MPTECREQVLYQSEWPPFRLLRNQEDNLTRCLGHIFSSVTHYFFKQKHVWAHLSVLILFIFKFTGHMTLQASLAFSLGE